MYTHISVEMITQQRLKEYRQQADLNRLLDQASVNRPARSSFFGKFFSRLFKTHGNRHEHPAGKDQAFAEYESSTWP